MSGGQQNKDEEVVKMVARMTELKEKQERSTRFPPLSLATVVVCVLLFVMVLLSSVSIFVFYWCEKRQARSVFYLFFAVFFDSQDPGSTKKEKALGPSVFMPCAWGGFPGFA